jgi:hypothetical protein
MQAAREGGRRGGTRMRDVAGFFMAGRGRSWRSTTMTQAGGGGGGCGVAGAGQGGGGATMAIGFIKSA